MVSVLIADITLMNLVKVNHAITIFILMKILNDIHHELKKINFDLKE